MKYPKQGEVSEDLGHGQVGGELDDAARWWRAYVLAEDDHADQLSELAVAGDNHAGRRLASWLFDRARMGEVIAVIPQRSQIAAALPQPPGPGPPATLAACPIARFLVVIRAVTVRSGPLMPTGSWWLSRCARPRVRAGSP